MSQSGPGSTAGTNVDPYGGATPRALIVDDEAAITTLVSRRLGRDGVDCVVANSGEEACDVFTRGGFDIVVTDVSMPGMSGLDLMRWVKARDPLVQVIIMTGHTEVETAVEAIRLDADDYVLKPFDLDQLARSFSRRLEHRRLVQRNQEYRLTLEQRVEEQSRRLEQLYLASIRSLVTALEAKDPHTRGHSERVTRYALAIAREMGGLDLGTLRVAAQLHDIGKIGARDEVLLKPGPLDAAEEDHIRQHPLIGVRILSPILDDRVVLDVVRHHHERWDGAGYPDGIAGEDIPVAARIVAVADAIDAITSPRTYRSARSWAEALREVEASSGTQFDASVVRVALRALQAGPAVAATGR